VRSHPVVGILFLLSGGALLVLGATAHSAPGILGRLPVPPEVVVPFILWQLATWALLFGLFFLRPRGGRRRRWSPRGAAPRV
jgi:hypothetical protein